MPITSSAKKALRVAKKKKIFNTRRKSTMDSSIKAIKKLIKDFRNHVHLFGRSDHLLGQ